MPVFFKEELEGVALFWRIYRKDGVTLGLTSHDLPLYFDGIEHRSAPGISPSAIKRSAGFEEESAEVEGALAHDSISAADLAAGKFDGARIDIGAVDWETLARLVVYSGRLGDVTQGPHEYSAQLRSAKRELERELVPYTSPTCRAEFCGPGCTLSQERFSTQTSLGDVDLAGNSITPAGVDVADYLNGRVTFLEGPQSGLTMALIAQDSGALVLDRPLHSDVTSGMRVRLVQGCDHTHATCHSRFDNAVNFRGEPFLPGNDLLTRYPKQR